MDLFSPAIVSRALHQDKIKTEVDLDATPPQKPAALDWRQVAAQVTFAQTHEGSGPKICETDRNLLTSVFPLEQKHDVVLCPRCARPCLSQMFTSHSQSCSQGSSARGPAPARRSSLHGSRVAEAPESGPNTNPANSSDTDSKVVLSIRKRKAETDRSAAKAKRSKPAAPRAKPKPKPVFNIDKQCGVLLANGQPCARSLTCKAHSMGAKRAVIGRSANYDTLLVNFQRQNMVKQAQISTKEALADSEPEETLTPEKELQLVMDGVQATHYVPLDRKVLMPSRTRSQFRIREMLALAMLPRELNGSDAIFGRALAFCSDNPNQLQFVRSPAQRLMIQKALALKKRQQQQQQQQQQKTS